MKAAQLLTQEFIKSILSYDSATGLFTWLPRPRDSFPDKRSFITWHSQFCGKVAGGPVNGYVEIRSFQRWRMYAHRLAWLYVYGVLPSSHIDHINHDRSDNRIENLRLANNGENNRNFSLRADSPHGIHGVYWCRRSHKWGSRISANRRTVHLGAHESFFDACCSRKSAEVRIGYHPNHGAPRRDSGILGRGIVLPEGESLTAETVDLLCNY